ncbi:uncharacterized protein MKK02DRAFT_39113 [Dioszegia hungarica]|uniref:Nucleoporin p58/p45 n=1 Tax=Dioszegia hungarica TaxID=4972 RepID=A0AA38LTX8_9TREE|nr:uncharacterized protein MKK02DRAFT_39113 [Dioszegia hungarica]KAI9633136.1 hypothetical protein MKK02DRAFT_39113 [Dioszegia hungarica]
MSGFSFGSTAPSGQQQQQSSVPSFSFTGASAAPSPALANAPTPFSFNNAGSGTGANGQAAQPQQSSLFAGAAQGQQQQQGQASGGFSFGNKPAQAPATGGGLFGQSTNTAQPPGGLFGQSTNTQPAGGLFGQSTSTPQPSGGLFGQPAQTQPAAAGGSSLFGGLQSQQSQQQPSLFGQTQQAQTGGTAPTPMSGGLGQQNSLWGSTSMGQNQQGGSGLQNSTLGASSSGAQGGLNKSTKFSELPEQFQKQIESMDAAFKQQKTLGQGINSEELGKAIWRTTTDIKSCTEESSALTQSLQNTAQALTALQARFITEEEDVRRLAEIVETYKAVDGRPGAMRVAGHKEWPGEFFGRVARGLEDRVARYKVTIVQLSRVVASLTNESDGPTPQAIAQTIHNHQNALVTLAAQLETLQVRMNGLKGTYAEEYRARTGSMRDPFEVAREEKGLPPVRA